MSMNIPFTPVEGAVALPALRPLGLLSQSFGREWALLPPNVSLRVELKALYAAMLRTFCLSSQAIRSMCRWEPRNAQAAANSAANVASHTAGAAASAASSVVAANGMRPAQPAARAPHRTSNLRLGGAVTLGGAAVLAWIVLDHPHRDDASRPAPVANSPASSRAAQIEPRPATVASARPSSKSESGKNPSASIGKSTNGNAHAATVANVGPAAPKQFAQASQPRSIKPAHTQEANPLSGTAAVASTVRKTTANVPATSVAAAPLVVESRDSASVTARRRSVTPTGAAHHATPSTESAVSHSVSARAKPSAAGEYSPFMPPALASSEYESVTMSARTDGANSAPSPRRQSTQGSVDASDTSWMTRMSQRRVTEVPELFSR